MKNSLTLHDFFLLCSNDNEEWGQQYFKNAGFSPKGSDKKITGLTSQSNNNVDTLIAPDRKVIDNIMGYARALFLVKTKKTGYFSIIMN